MPETPRAPAPPGVPFDPPDFLTRLNAAPCAIVDGPAPNGADGAWLLEGAALEIAAASADALPEACAAIEQAARTRHVLLLLDYELGAWLEAKVPGRPLTRAPLCAWAFPQARWVAREPLDAALAQAVAQLPEWQRQARIGGLDAGMSREAHAAAVERILRYIREGDCYQVNLTYPLHFRRSGAELALYAALRRRQPVRHGAFVRVPGRTILSLSPELFLERDGDRLRSRPMKGTAPRGATAEEDALRAQRLAASQKDRAENLMIVDLIRNDLGRLAIPGSVRVESLFAIESYPTVLQMVSTVSARVADAGLLDILRALFPCGSITGAPKIRAMQIAAELERGPRGIYTGSIGHLRPGGALRMNVAIRTLELDEQGEGRLGVGGGIVADSRPEAEYAECEAKARFLTELPAGFELFETMLCRPGDAEPFPYRRYHLARLEASARHFAFRFDAARVEAALAQALAGLPATPHRVRLALREDGEPGVAARPLDPLPEPALVGIARERTRSANVFLRHKTTVRSEYDAGLREAVARGWFDLLHFNERGELTEGARSNVFLVHRGRWSTPPLACGLLGGVMRRVLLERGAPAIEERVLAREDLLSADEIHVSNALRGLVRAQLTPPE